MEKLTQTNFIKKSKTQYGNEAFDYSLVKYVNISSEIDLICKKHGLFKTTPNKHLKIIGGCPLCSKELRKKKKKITNEEYKKLVVKKHGYIYDLSKTVYNGMKNNVIATCSKHGDFNVNAYNFVHLQGCPKCGLELRSNCQKVYKKEYTKLTTEEFIVKSNSLFNNFYSYEKVNLEKKDDKNRVCITCPIHGDFWQNPYSHLKGCGCRKCSIQKKGEKRTLTTEEYIKKCNLVHNFKYDYTCTTYNGCHENVEITCPIHGNFKQKAYSHLIGHGCPKCANEKNSKKLLSDCESFIQKAKKIHGDSENYSLVNYQGAKVPVTIICKKGHKYSQMPNKHLSGHGCPYCSNVSSKAEEEIYEYVKLFFPSTISHDRTILNGRKLTNNAKFSAIMKKMSFDEFQKKAILIHGENYIYDKDSFVNTKQKMWMTHKNCGYKFQQTPHNHLNGQGCPKCCYKNRPTNYSFIEESKKRFGDRFSFPNFDEEYKNSHSKITIRCNLCGKCFTKKACDFITSSYGGCNCQKEQEKYITYEDLIKQYNKNEIIPFEGLKHKSNDKIQLVCKEHGLYEKYIKDLFNNKDQCQICGRLHNGDFKKLSFNDIEKRLKERYPNIEILNKEQYVNTTSKLSFKCNVCGNIFERTCGSFLYSNLFNGCPNCTKIQQIESRTKTQEKFETEVKLLYGDLYTVKGQYVSSDKKILIKCNDCGRAFEIEANSFLQGHGCPFHNLNYSINEDKIYEHIKTLYSNTIANDRKILKGYELDIYIPERKIAIEYNGLYWHSELKKDKNYHLNKTIECEKQGIRLIHIFEDEWLYKSEIWKSMLNNILGLTKNKVQARKCTIREAYSQEAIKFLNENHIQGWCPSQIKLGLYYNNELMSIMTFGKSRHFIGNGETEYELLRFCNKLNTTVIGGASKLFNYFVKTYNPNSIISYADRRWSNGNLYNVLGFEFIHNSKPNYYYIIGTNRKNRFNFRKSILVKKYNCPKNMSEKEFCRQQKWYRIYDCGTKVYKWRQLTANDNKL